MGKFLTFIFAIFAIALFFSPQIVKATEPGDVVINEVMWMGSKASSSDEWIELHNMTSKNIDLSGWSIDNAGTGGGSLQIPITGQHTLLSNGYYLISHYSMVDNVLGTIKTHLNIIVGWRTSSMASFSLANSGNGDLILRDDQMNIIDQAEGDTWPAGDNTNKYSMERNLEPGDGLLKSNWHTASDSVGFVDGATERGTPENSVSNPPPPPPPKPKPLAPDLASPIDTANFIGKNTLTFTWTESDLQTLTYEFILSNNDDLSDPIIDEPDLTNLQYLAEDLDWGTYYWQVIAANATDETPSSIFSFTLAEPVYSDNIVTNELWPNPSSDEINEYIELYNNSTDIVNLKGWAISDIKGTIKKYTIGDIDILPFGYIALTRAQTGITLNNDQDGARLYQPNGKLLYETSVFSDGGEGWAWARTNSGKWTWTIKTSMGKANIFKDPPTEEETSTPTLPEEKVLNKNPINIKTGEFRNFEQYLVAVTGTVITTSGNTFYLDDGSGPAKIYIQDKTGIEKPPMHKGDLFGIIGIVDLYRSTWRILPQKQSDVKLIQAIKELQTESTATSASSTSTSGSSTAGKSTAQARAPTIEPIKEVKAAESTNPANTSAPKNSFWFQFIEALTGLAIIFLILLVIRARKFPRVKVIGGHFGEDET